MYSRSRPWAAVGRVFEFQVLRNMLNQLCVENQEFITLSSFDRVIRSYNLPEISSTYLATLLGSCSSTLSLVLGVFKIRIQLDGIELLHCLMDGRTNKSWLFHLTLKKLTKHPGKIAHGGFHLSERIGLSYFEKVGKTP